MIRLSIYCLLFFSTGRLKPDLIDIKKILQIPNCGEVSPERANNSTIICNQ